jgi:hypothetical protein
MCIAPTCVRIKTHNKARKCHSTFVRNISNSSQLNLTNLNPSNHCYKCAAGGGRQQQQQQQEEEEEEQEGVKILVEMTSNFLLKNLTINTDKTCSIKLCKICIQRVHCLDIFLRPFQLLEALSLVLIGCSFWVQRNLPPKKRKEISERERERELSKARVLHSHVHVKPTHKLLS